MTDEAMSPLRRRMIEDMTIRKLAAKTQRGYIRSVKDFVAFLGRSPDTASFEDVRRFQLHLAASGAHIPILNHTVASWADRVRLIDARCVGTWELPALISEMTPLIRFASSGAAEAIVECLRPSAFVFEIQNSLEKFALQVTKKKQVAACAATRYRTSMSAIRHWPLSRFGQHADNFLALSLRGGRGFRKPDGVSLDVENCLSCSIVVVFLRSGRSPALPSSSLSTFTLYGVVRR